MRERDLLSRFVLGAIAFCLCAIVAATFFMSENSTLKAIGAILLSTYLFAAFATDWFLAMRNEKHVEDNPHLLKNEAVGETVTVSGDFEVQSGTASGVVILHGAIWKAYCSGCPAPRDGDAMVVLAREGLTLVVQPQVSVA